MLARIYGPNRLFTAKFQSCGVKPDDIRSLTDLSRLPLTTKSELLHAQTERSPFGSNATFPESAYTRVHQTSGTTGTPLRVIDTPDSWELWGRCWVTYSPARVWLPGTVYSSPSPSAVHRILGRCRRHPPDRRHDDSRRRFRLASAPSDDAGYRRDGAVLRRPMPFDLQRSRASINSTCVKFQSARLFARANPAPISNTPSSESNRHGARSVMTTPALRKSDRTVANARSSLGEYTSSKASSSLKF